MDFAGPFLVRRGKSRKPIKIITYAAVFVCFSTRTVHLELCTDLSTNAFIAALTRFCCRRGTPAHLYSDNGSNFIGARREMEEIRTLLTSKETSNRMSHFSSDREFYWYTSPPCAPHFGGLW